jgi:Protein of unknown function (DUF1329)
MGRARILNFGVLKMKKLTLLGMAIFGATSLNAFAAVTAEEAAKLKTTLTPVGAERAGNADGTIPAWSGGYTTPTPGFVNGGKRPDPFAADKPSYSITSKNYEQHADKLSEGSKLMFKRNADFRIDVYPTRRTFAAPQFIYDRTAKSATTVTMVDGPGGPVPKGYTGGIPFPIPKTAEEVMTNHQLRWNGDGSSQTQRGYIVTAQGKAIFAAENLIEGIYPQNMETPVAADWDGNRTRFRITTLAPSVAKGSATLAWGNIDNDKALAWTYLTGQRRVRKLPNSCCDTPVPNAAGTMTFDEVQLWEGKLNRFDWKLVGKKELIVPYNTNRTMIPKEADLFQAHFLNPDHVRWELHRVWAVEATLKPGQRHVYSNTTYYVDEDSWIVLLSDRRDAQNTLAKTMVSLPFVAPDYPLISSVSFVSYDLTTGAWTVQNLLNEQASQFKRVTKFPANQFSPDALEAEGVR